MAPTTISAAAGAVLDALVATVPADRSRPLGLMVRDIVPLALLDGPAVVAALAELRTAHLASPFSAATTGKGMQKGARHWAPTPKGRAHVSAVVA